MLATRWQPFGDVWCEVNRLHNELNRQFGRCGEGDRSLARSYPALNVWEDQEKLHVEAELPGMEMDDLEILIHGNELTIKGERKKPELKDASWRRRERGFGRFSRALELPDDVDAEKVEAHFRNGVLLIELPKREEAKPRRIEVKAN
jgi:HSP20 family protein